MHKENLVFIHIYVYSILHKCIIISSRPGSGVKNDVFWDVTPCVVRTDVSEELSASYLRVTRIGELGTTLAVTSNRRTLVASYS
jgi:hypothetical protein